MKAQIEVTDRKVADLEKAEERATVRKVAALEKAEAADVTKPEGEADVAETGRAGARNGRERSNNQHRSARPEQESARSARAPPRGPGPGPAELEGEGWHDSKTKEKGRWPRLLETAWRRRALRGGDTRVAEHKIYEFPRGTARGQYQLWVDGNYAENVTEKMNEAKGDLMALYGRDAMDGWEGWEE